MSERLISTRLSFGPKVATKPATIPSLGPTVKITGAPRISLDTFKPRETVSILKAPKIVIRTPQISAAAKPLPDISFKVIDRKPMWAAPKAQTLTPITDRPVPGRMTWERTTIIWQTKTEPSKAATSEAAIGKTTENQVVKSPPTEIKINTGQIEKPKGSTQLSPTEKSQQRAAPESARSESKIQSLVKDQDIQQDLDQAVKTFQAFKKAGLTEVEARKLAVAALAEKVKKARYPATKPSLIAKQEQEEELEQKIARKMEKRIQEKRMIVERDERANNYRKYLVRGNIDYIFAQIRTETEEEESITIEGREIARLIPSQNEDPRVKGEIAKDGVDETHPKWVKALGKAGSFTTPKSAYEAAVRAIEYFTAVKETEQQTAELATPEEVAQVVTSRVIRTNREHLLRTIYLN